MKKPEHSPLGGSTLKRWSSCPGSIRLSRGIPNRSSAYADEGTRAHEVAAEYLNQKRWSINAKKDVIDAVSVYTDAINADWKGVDGFRWVEHKFSLEEIHDNLYGTADCVIYDSKKKLLRVYDYKHGQGTIVEVVEDGEPNLQLLYYALGAAITLNLSVDELEVIIVQPRASHPDGPIRRAKVDGLYLLEFAANLKTWALATQDPQAPLKSGGHCKFCPAAHSCPELNKTAVSRAKEEFSSLMPYDPSDLSDALTRLPMLEIWIHSVREFAYVEAQAGRAPPGWKLVMKRATRKWRDEKLAAADLLNVAEYDDLYTEPKLRTPAQVEKILHKDDKEWLTKNVVAESSGMSLVPTADKRPAVICDAKTEFSKMLPETSLIEMEIENE